MRKLIWLALGFGVACLACAVFYGEWFLLGGGIMLLLTIAFAVLRKQNKKCAILFWTILGSTLGLLWFVAYDALFVTIPRVADGQTLYVTVEASDYSYKSEYGSAVEGTVVLAQEEYRVKAYYNGDQQLSPGDHITGTFRFRLTTDGGLENPTNHRTEGIFLLAYPNGSMEITPAEETQWRHYPAIWRRQILNRIHELLPEEAGSFAAALLLGDRTGITYEMDTSFKVSGISHIIAVSGLHVSILFGLLYTLLARRRVLSCLIGIPVLFLFAAIAGFTPSITRACIMQALMLLAMLFEREYDGPSALAFAVLTMLFANPLTVLSVSFQLSVGCMIGIFLFAERIREYFLRFSEGGILKSRKRLGRIYKGIASSVSVSLSATIVTTPLVAYYFGCVSIFGVFTNLLTLWVISYIFYALIVVLLVSLVHMGFAKILAAIVTVPIGYVLGVARGISKLPMAGVYTSNPYVVVWLVGIYGFFALFMCMRKKKPALLVASMVFTLLLTQLFSWLEPMQDNLRMTVLDVGQGQSILLQSDGKSFLVDCGGDYDEDAADIAAEALLNQGISRLDGIVVTHYDEDHAGGITELLSRVETDRLILPYIPEDAQSMESITNASDGVVDYITQDVNYTFGDTKITIFAPFSQESDNESSICILFKWQDCDILITGDRGSLGERMLMESHELPEVDILVAGHHGSAGSTSKALLDAVSPETVFISVGADNRYGHPAEALLQRLQEAGCDVYRTDMNGTIIFRR